MRRVIDDSDSEDKSPGNKNIMKMRSNEKKRKEKQSKLGVGGLNLEAIRGEDDEDSEVNLSESGDELDQEGQEQREPFMGPNAKCLRHKLKIHSYRKGTKQLLCTQCIQEFNVPSELVKILP